MQERKKRQEEQKEYEAQGAILTQREREQATAQLMEAFATFVLEEQPRNLVASALPEPVSTVERRMRTRAASSHPMNPCSADGLVAADRHMHDIEQRRYSPR